MEFDYEEYLRLAQIPEGSVIEVSSDLLSIGVFCREHELSFHADRMIDALKELVGNEGTVLIRSFSWKFCKGIVFDAKKTKSEVGALGTLALKRNDFKRTRHPIYSWMVWGKYQEELCACENVESFGLDSPFGFLDKQHALQLMIGDPGFLATTIAHYAEIKAGGIPYRREKMFEADYIDEYGKRTRPKYSMYVRPLNIKVEVDGAKTERILLQQGIAKKFFYRSELQIATLDLCSLVKFYVEDILNNDGRNFVVVDGMAGIRGCDVDWSKAEFS